MHAERKHLLTQYLASSINVLYEVKTNTTITYERRMELIHSLQTVLIPSIMRQLMYFANVRDHYNEEG